MNFYLFNEDTGVSITIGLIDKITSASIKCKYQVQVQNCVPIGTILVLSQLFKIHCHSERNACPELVEGKRSRGISIVN